MRLSHCTQHEMRWPLGLLHLFFKLVWMPVSTGIPISIGCACKDQSATIKVLTFLNFYHGVYASSTVVFYCYFRQGKYFCCCFYFSFFLLRKLCFIFIDTTLFSIAYYLTPVFTYPFIMP